MVSPLALESTRRAVSAPIGPLKLAAGTKRRVVFAARYRAFVSSRPAVAMFVHMLVPLACHCHVPCVEPAALAVMATPAKVLAELPPATASVESLKLLAKSAETKAPVGAAVSSLTAVKEAVVVTNVGASLTAVMLVPRDTVAEL